MRFFQDCSDCGGACKNDSKSMEFCSEDGFTEYDLEDGRIELDDNDEVIKVNW